MSSELALPEGLAPPMENGEVVFEAPWQSRVFGMAVVLSEQGLYPWADFQTALIDAVAEWESSHDEDAQYPYFEVFLTAFMNLLERCGQIDAQTVQQIADELAALPHGHDHDHSHHHHHHHHDHSHD